MNSSERKALFLGMAHGTAVSRLRRNVMLHLLTRLGENFCYVCGGVLDDVNDFTMEYVLPWENRDVALFWDLGNISFSHLRCNTPHLHSNRIDTTRCINGHLLTPDNVYIQPGNQGRYCRTCKRESYRRWRNNKKVLSA